MATLTLLGIPSDRPLRLPRFLFALPDNYTPARCLFDLV